MNPFACSGMPLPLHAVNSQGRHSTCLLGEGLRGAAVSMEGFEWRFETSLLTGAKKWGLIAEREGAVVVSEQGGIVRGWA